MIAVGLLPVLAACVVLWVPKSRMALGAARTLALGAALVVILAELLPSAASALGAKALLVAALGLAVPWAAERWMHGHRASYVAFVALAMHQVADGAQAGALASMGPWVVLAVVGHGAPLVAASLLASERHEGRASAWRAWALLVLATGAGMWFGSSVAPWVEPAEPWLQAAVGGLLLHVLAHDLSANLPERTSERVADIVALVVGVGGVAWMLGEHAGAHHGHGAHVPFLSALLRLSAITAPAMALGLVADATMEWLGAGMAHGPVRASTSRAEGILSGVLRAWVAPVYTCSIEEIGQRHAKRGAGFVVALLVAGPALGLDTLLVSVVWLGWGLAVVRLGSVLVGAVVGAAAAGLPAARPRHGHGHEGGPAGFLGGIDRQVAHAGPWVGAGLMVAAYIEAFVPVDPLGGLAWPVLVWVSLPVYFHATGVVPVAAVLWGKGVGAGAVLALLVLGPSVNLALFQYLRGTYGAGAAWRGLGALVLLVGAAGLVMQGVPAPTELPSITASGLAEWSAAALLGAAAVRGVWASGVRGWLASLVVEHHHHHHEEEEHGPPGH